MFFHLQILKGVKSNIFTCKLCLWVIFTILFTRLQLCDNSNSLTYEPQKGTKSNTFTCQPCYCTSHADWLSTVIILTWMYEDLFCFVTNALQWLPLTRAPRGFSSIQTYGSVEVNQPLAKRRIFSPFLKHFGRKFWHLSRFCNTLLQDLTPLHVKITRSAMSVCRRKPKLWTFLHTVSYKWITT